MLFTLYSCTFPVVDENCRAAFSSVARCRLRWGGPVRCWAVRSRWLWRKFAARRRSELFALIAWQKMKNCV